MLKTASTFLALSAFTLAACDSSDAAHDPAHSSQASAHMKEEAAERKTDTAPQGGPVSVAVNEEGFQPSRIEVPRGDPVTLRFTRTTEKTCATEVAFPELGLKKPLPLNQPVDVQVPAKESRTLAFQCGMGMYRSQLVIN